MVLIKEVKTRKEQKLFVNFPLKLYKNCPYFIPPLYNEEMKIFTNRHAYSDVVKTIHFLAYIDNEVVGRIEGIIQLQYNEIHNVKYARFNRIDFINNQEVCNELLQAVEDWAKSLSMDVVVGPLGYSDLEREGLLVEGFDQDCTFEEQYQYSYYKDLIENYQYTKDVDWLEFIITKPETVDPKLVKISSRVLDYYGLKVADNSINKFKYFNKYKDGFFYCLDECYKDLYGTVPFTSKMKKVMVSEFKYIANKKYLKYILDKNDNVVAFAFCIPSLSDALRYTKGKLTPKTLIKLLKARNHPQVIDFALIGVLPNWRMSGIHAVLLKALVDELSSGDLKYCETNLNLEENAKILGTWKYFNKKQNKRRRCYIKNI